MSKLVKLYKIGKSEHKRKDLINSYFGFIEALKDEKRLFNLSWSQNIEICEVLLNYRVYYDKICKPNVKIGREKSLFVSLNLIQNSSQILPTKFFQEIVKNSDINCSQLAMSATEYHYLLMILFNNSQNNQMQTFDILQKILKNENYIYEINQDYKNYLMTLNIDEFKRNFFHEAHFKSGSAKSNVFIDGTYHSLKTSKDTFIKLWLEATFSQNKDDEIKLITF